jgi:hypothetical protein
MFDDTRVLIQQGRQLAGTPKIAIRALRFGRPDQGLCEQPVMNIERFCHIR